MVSRGLGFGSRSSPYLRGARRTPSAEHLDRQYRTSGKRSASQHPQPAAAVVPATLAFQFTSRTSVLGERADLPPANQTSAIDIKANRFGIFYNIDLLGMCRCPPLIPVIPPSRSLPKMPKSAGCGACFARDDHLVGSPAHLTWRWGLSQLSGLGMLIHLSAWN